ncbi:hypothetical protein M409DRAFT_62010 [Zasmidium cellare ATCC 36951]|uniref:Major facilitator superfamily (MFS) profile domain-containing protein n=1 Tax=Zasmidium cellare ATCC 36951 TaxID=1080233 RepID=A0A6A6D2V9_ZASCE|nr:uncharacterized protein M409DRAFT_62010 [Zasmidium cellare ATCC 36951]KAF2173734.1 hypothetical protein M409DRAFT_62010 [Zasmidium cellare ATCC 36951]
MLPRADGGKDAWLVLAGVFALESVVWGFPFSFGVFQEYYASHEPFSKDSSTTAAISTTASGIMYLSSPLVALVLQRWPHIRRPSGIVGLIIMLAALVGASFCNSSIGLLATQGIMFAVGGLTLYFPAMLVIDEWFIQRKGLAFGICWTATGTSGAIIPFLFQWLLNQYGFRTALRVWAVISACIVPPALMVMKTRIPPSQVSSLRPLNLSFLKQQPFWWFQAGNFAQGLAYFVPLLWIPSFASAQGFPSISGTLALALLNIAACGGLLLQGFLVDRFSVSIVMLGVTLISALSIFLLWGFTVSQPILYVFVILWGLSGAGYPAMWSGCAQEMAKHGFYGNSAGAQYGYTIDTGLVIGLFCAMKGVASLVSGPISEALLNAKPLHGADFIYGGTYGPVIIFAGVGAMLGGTACIGKAFKAL